MHEMGYSAALIRGVMIHQVTLYAIWVLLSNCVDLAMTLGGATSSRTTAYRRDKAQVRLYQLFTPLD